MLPYSRQQTYNPSSPLASADLNAVQDWIVHTWDALAGKDFVYSEDFLSDFAHTTLDATAAPHCSTAGDNAFGGFGVALITHVVANPPDVLQSNWLWPLTGRVFRFAARVRFPFALPIKATTYFDIGLAGSGADQLLFRAVGGAGTWGIMTTTPPVTATTVAYDSAYHLFELRCDGTNVVWAIDGAVVATTVLALSFDATLFMRAHLDPTEAGGTAIAVDHVRLWAGR